MMRIPFHRTNAPAAGPVLRRAAVGLCLTAVLAFAGCGSRCAESQERGAVPVAAAAAIPVRVAAAARVAITPKGGVRRITRRRRTEDGLVVRRCPRRFPSRGQGAQGAPPVAMKGAHGDVAEFLKRIT
jgi:hypothetical protein